MGKKKAIVADDGVNLQAKKQKKTGKENHELADGGIKLPAKKQKVNEENHEFVKKAKNKKLENGTKEAKKRKSDAVNQEDDKVDTKEVSAEKITDGGSKKKQKKGTNEAATLPAKKPKLEAVNQEDDKVDTKEDSEEKTKDASRINTKIFGIFNELNKNENEPSHKKLKCLLSLLTSEAHDKKSTATIAYALKRLVRCTGADDMNAVAMSGSYLCGILRNVPDIDPIQLLETLKRELPVGSQQKGKEESLAAVGHLMTILAILNSPHFDEPSVELIKAIYPILVTHLKGREYVVNMCADIMADSFKKVNASLFQTHVWPLLQKELSKPLTNLKLHSCDLLLAVHLNYPKLLPLKKLESSLWRLEPNYKQLFELYMNSQSIQESSCYARLARFLATTAGGELLGEWREHIVEQLPLKHNTAKAYVLQTLTFILLHFDDTKLPMATTLEPLFADVPLMSMVLQELSIAKQLTEKLQENAKPSQVKLRSICRQFEGALLLSFNKQLKNDDSKLCILQHLLQLQLQLDGIMQTPRITQRLLDTLGEKGLQAMYKFYSEQFTSNKENLSKMHRENCLKYMQCLLLHPLLLERRKQLEFLLPIAICHLNEQREPCQASEAAAFSRQGASRCEELLFTCLIHKMGNSTKQLVAQLRQTLQELAKLLAQPQIETKLRTQQTPELLAAWQQVLKVVNAPVVKEQSDLALVFDALILFLGLAIHTPSCNIPIEVVNDLFICKQNALIKTKGKKKADAEQLNWQDVITDVLLQLLLQTGHYWREFVTTIGSTLMPHLVKENLEQLLIVLDMNKNPLGDKQDEQEESDDEEQEEEEEQSTDDDEQDVDDDEDDDEDDEAASDDEEATNLELIRENVRKALLNDDNDDEQNDASSVDWNDVDEAEGERLNLALERAFQAFKPKKSQSNKTKDQHQTKSERINSTTLLHFRVRVLELVELFVNKHPQMDVLLDALTSVYYVYQESSRDNKLQPLAEASKKLLRKLLTQKIDFSSADEDKKPILDCIQQFIAPEETNQAQSQQQAAKKHGDLAIWRNKCVAYLVSQFSETDVTKSGVWPLLQDYLHDWVSRRNSPHTLASFDAIFLTTWQGIPNLAICFATLLSTDLRNFRRHQVLDLLTKHIGRIRIALANNPSAAKEFSTILNNYEPIGGKDRDQHKKLLNQLNKSAKGLGTI